MSDYDHLDALIERGEMRERFADCQKQAKKYIFEHGTDELVKELRKARDEWRTFRIGTINTLVLLEHIDKLEAELSKSLVKP